MRISHTAWLHPWHSYIYFVQIRGVCWKWNEIEIDNAKYDPKSDILGLFGFFRLNKFTKMASFNVFFFWMAVLKDQNKICHRKYNFFPDQTNNNSMVRSFSASKSCISLVLQSNCVYTGRPYDEISYLKLLPDSIPTVVIV